MKKNILKGMVCFCMLAYIFCIYAGIRKFWWMDLVAENKQGSNSTPTWMYLGGISYIVGYCILQYIFPKSMTYFTENYLYILLIPIVVIFVVNFIF